MLASVKMISSVNHLMYLERFCYQRASLPTYCRDMNLASDIHFISALISEYQRFLIARSSTDAWRTPSLNPVVAYFVRPLLNVNRQKQGVLSIESVFLDLTEC